VIALGVIIGTFGTHRILPGAMTVEERQLALWSSKADVRYNAAI